MCISLTEKYSKAGTLTTSFVHLKKLKPREVK